MEGKKGRNIKFWAAQSVDGQLVTAQNKKLLREAIAAHSSNFKGTKIMFLEVKFEKHHDLASKLMGKNLSNLLTDTTNVSVISEYDA